jgi:hypothetical protein
VKDPADILSQAAAGVERPRIIAGGDDRLAQATAMRPAEGTLFVHLYRGWVAQWLTNDWKIIGERILGMPPFSEGDWKQGYGSPWAAMANAGYEPSPGSGGGSSGGGGGTSPAPHVIGVDPSLTQPMPAPAIKLRQTSPLAFGAGTATLPVAPRAGSLLIAAASVRGAGDTQVREDWSIAWLAPQAGFAAWMYYRVANAAGPQTFAMPGLGADRGFLIMEFTGANSMVDAANSAFTLANAGIWTTPPVTPQPNQQALLVAMALKDGSGIPGGNTLPDIRFDPPWTRVGITGTIVTQDQSPTMALGYRVIDAPSGAYVGTGTQDATGFAAGTWANLIAAFTRF